MSVFSFYVNLSPTRAAAVQDQSLFLIFLVVLNKFYISRE